MSSGRDHTAATLGLALIYLTADWRIAVWMPIGLLLQPDLDVDGGYIGYKFLRPYSILYYSWKTYWWPYSKVIPHRSGLSHWPLVGTAIRILYLVGPASLVYYFIKGSWPLFYLFDYQSLLKALVLTDFLHFVMDFYNPDGPSNPGVTLDKTPPSQQIQSIRNRRSRRKRR